MKHYLNKILLACVTLALTVSCGKQDEGTSNHRSESHEAYLGTWQASSAQPVGFSLGYATKLKIESDGTCEMKVQYDTSQFPQPGRFSDMIHLGGKWEVEDGMLAVRLKILSWVVTDWGSYQKEESFDDFVSSIRFVFDRGHLRPENYQLNLGTTEEARGISLMAKGKGIILTYVMFSRE